LVQSRVWRIDGTWERMNRAMRRRLREKLGREPSAGMVDSQSAKTTGVGGEQRGFDGGKKVRGRKRHILVDTEGLVVEARVHNAKVPDRDGIRRLLDPTRARLSRLSHLWADAGYRGRGKVWAEEALGVEVEIGCSGSARRKRRSSVATGGWGAKAAAIRAATTTPASSTVAEVTGAVASNYQGSPATTVPTDEEEVTHEPSRRARRARAASADAIR
jgi:transposase